MIIILLTVFILLVVGASIGLYTLISYFQRKRIEKLMRDINVILQRVHSELRIATGNLTPTPPYGAYVYAILNGDEIIYLGKGTHNRVYQSLHNHQGTGYVFLDYGLSDEQALAEEKGLIQRFHRCGVPLENIIYN